MPTDRIPAAAPASPSVDAAFVVHLIATESAPESACGRVEHISSGQSTRFASVAELLAFMRHIVASVVVLLAFALPVRGDDACLTGSAVDADAAAITALRAGIDSACPCASFDGTPGKARNDYLRCAKRELGAAIDAGALRVKCKSLVKRVFQTSTCGRKPHLQALPCIETTNAGKIRCAIRPADACRSKPGRYARLACPAYATCVDAGDGNADYRVDRLDSGACVSTPSPTPSTTGTGSPTLTPTWTPTATATATASDTPTATPADTATATPADTATATPTATPTLTSTVCTASGPIVARIDVNKDVDPQIVVWPPDPAANHCGPQSLLGGGCEIRGLDGTITNSFDASASVDGARCPGDPLPSFHWQIFRPPGLGVTPYSAAGISGYHGSMLTILPNSFPSLEDSDAAGDPTWRVLLTIQSNVFPFQSTAHWFRFEYAGSNVSLEISTDCQRFGTFLGDDCATHWPNSLPATEPT